ncbi:MAG: YchF/TatD family DNA exonuclease, partial [Deltaproteobacteria bacterium]|nr:YchF/TatD family DNA exonuclease [Deltaproteobacteria bacterium]
MEKPVFIDTHAHLDDRKFDTDRSEVIRRAEEAGVKTIITVGCWHKARGFKPTEDVLKAYGSIFGAPSTTLDETASVPFQAVVSKVVLGALGVHPHEAKDVKDNAPYELIRSIALKESVGAGRIVAVGETGLDYHYEHSPKDVQKEVFIRQVRLSRELNLPLIIHSREADVDTLGILKAEGAENTGGVFHCFSGSLDTARAALDMGFHLSFTGVVTFPNAKGLCEVVKSIPIERMLIETDCPYLAPVPHRGKRNEPAFVAHIAKAISDVKGMSIEDVGRITALNAEGLFGLKETGTAKIAYGIRNSLYLNITNRCSNYCTFCAKFKSYIVKGHYLRLREEPDFNDVIRAAGPGPEKYDEVVFCGFGEPLIRLDLVKQAGMHLKRMGCKIRIDTDGLANLVHKRNVLPE